MVEVTPNPQANHLKPLSPRPPQLTVLWPRVLVLGLVVVGIVLEHGFAIDHPFMPLRANHIAQLVLFAVAIIETVVSGLKFDRWWLGRRGPESLDVAAAVIAVIGASFAAMGHGGGWWVFQICVSMLFAAQCWRVVMILAQRLERPGVLLPASFLALIIVGTLMIKLPLATPEGVTLTWTDALFTMTSAVCVTGLAVRDTGSQFTPFGQAIIAVFIQLGGLGIIVFGSMAALMLGRAMTLRQHLSLSQMLNDQPISRVAGIVKFTVLSTLGFELLGALLMMPMWHGDLTLTERFGTSLFHSVSAYCNAGFALQSDSLVDYRYHGLSHLIMVPLIVIGGLGYPVLFNFWEMMRYRGRKRAHWRSPEAHRQEQEIVRGRLTLHTKLVLVTTLALYLFGFVGIFAGQLMPHVTNAAGLNTTANRTEPPDITVKYIGGTLADASFMSVTARTAGFNTMPMDELQPGSRLVIMSLMMVGGSPGGTAGGMRTTTLALLVLSIVATIRQRPDTEAFERRIPEVSIRKAGTMAACFVGVTVVVTLLLRMVEPMSLQQVMFEAISAVTVTGLSLGITDSMSTWGKYVIIGAMFLGRIGPLSLLVALTFGGGSGGAHRYPREDVVMG